MDDRQLLRQYAATRSDAAFAQLVDRHKDWVYSTCLRRLRSLHLAEDAAQAVFIALAQKAPSLVGHQSIAGWLYQAARYVCFSLLKLQQRRTKHETEVARMTALATPDAGSDLWNKLAPDLEPALDRLPEKYRVPLLLRFYQQKTLGQIAADLHISEPAAQKRVNRGLEKLRHRLNPAVPLAESSLLPGALLANCLHAAPASLSASSVTAALAGSAGAGFTLSQGALSMMFLAKLKTLAAAISLILVVLGGGAALTYVLSQHESTALAAAPAPATPPAAAEAEQRAAFVAPYLHDDTMLVVHIDAARIDMDAIGGSLAKKVADISGISPAEMERVQEALGQMKQVGGDFLTKFTKAGGRHAYFVFSQSADNAPKVAAMLFPLETPNADAHALTELLATIPGAPSATQLNDHLVVITEPDEIEALRGPAASRPDLQQALKAATGDIQIVCACNDATRAALNRHVGKGKLNTLIDTGQYLAASIHLPPNTGSVVTLQFDSADHATAAADEWNKFITDLLVQTSATAPPGVLDQFKDLFLLSPAGTTAQMKLDDAGESATALAVILPAMAKAKNNGANSTMNAIKQNLLGALMYAADNNNNWPETMQAVVDKGYMPSSKILTDPTDPKHRPFEYHPWTADQLKLLDAASTPVIWEPTDDATRPLAVGYLDGHVQMLAGKKDLDLALEAAKNKINSR